MSEHIEHAEYVTHFYDASEVAERRAEYYRHHGGYGDVTVKEVRGGVHKGRFMLRAAIVERHRYEDA